MLFAGIVLVQVGICAPVVRADADADVILLLPAADLAEENDLLTEASAWISRREGEGLTVCPVSLYTILDYYGYPSGSDLTTEEIRLYLRGNFTHRSSGDSSRGRYLFLLSRQEEDLGADYLPIPRYDLTTGLDTIATDSPYGFIGQETLDGGDGVVDIEDLDYSDPTLLVCRIPISSSGELGSMLANAIAYEESDFRRDLVLVAGMIIYEGDSAYIQSINAGQIDEPSTRVFDTDLFSPDYITTGAEQRLYTYLVSDDFDGGIIYNISHGGSSAIYAYNTDDPFNPVSFQNLAVDDLGDLSPDKLNIFISIACANDNGSSGLARQLFDSSSVAVISATRNVDPIDYDCVMAGETTFLPYFYEQDKTLLQSIQGTRSDYYQTCALGEGDDSLIAFSNILAFNIYGDGLISIAEETPTPTPSPSVNPSPTAFISATPSPNPTTPSGTVTPVPSPSPAATASGTVTPVPSPSPTSSSAFVPTPALTATPVSSTTPLPTPHSPLPIPDFNGDGTAEIAVFRHGAGLWAVRGLTRVYFGASGDIPVEGDYDGDGRTDIGIFREATGLWAIRSFSRMYFGAGGDIPVPGDYNGDGSWEPALFRPTTGLWAVAYLTRFYFGQSGDEPVPGDYTGDGSEEAGIFRDYSGLWAIRKSTRLYFGSSGDEAVAGDYDGNGFSDVGIFRPATGLWAVRGMTRRYFGTNGDEPVPADFDGSGGVDIAVFRSTSGLWAVGGRTRVYYGTAGDQPVVP